MATPHPTAAPSFVQSLPPDPYSGDPLSVFFVVFRPLANWPGYGVDSAGTAWTCWERARGVRGRYCFGASWRPLRYQPSHGGHHGVRLRRDRREHKRFVHGLVLEAFVGPRPPGMEACHNDGDTENNDLRNLRWDTHLANMRDAIRHGTQTRGCLSGRAKLTEEQVREIRCRRTAGKSFAAIGSEFGVTHTTVRSICIGVLWRHVL